MEYPDTLVVRSKTFRLSKTSASPSYSGPVYDQITCVVVQDTSTHLWTAALVEMGPEPVWIPAVASAETAQTAIELAFAHASVPADAVVQSKQSPTEAEENVNGPPPLPDRRASLGQAQVERAADGLTEKFAAHLRRLVGRAGERKARK